MIKVNKIKLITKNTSTLNYKLQNVASTALGHLGDRSWLLALRHPLHDAHSLLHVGEVHCSQLGVDDLSVDSDFKRRSATNFP